MSAGEECKHQCRTMKQSGVQKKIKCLIYHTVHKSAAIAKVFSLLACYVVCSDSRRYWFGPMRLQLLSRSQNLDSTIVFATPRHRYGFMFMETFCIALESARRIVVVSLAMINFSDRLFVSSVYRSDENRRLETHVDVRH